MIPSRGLLTIRLMTTCHMGYLKLFRVCRADVQKTRDGLPNSALPVLTLSDEVSTMRPCGEMNANSK
jgi:hypothetical protein